MKIVAVFLALIMLFGCVSEAPVSGTEISEPAFETSEPEVFEIPEAEEVTTSLGSLLSKFKL